MVGSTCPAYFLLLAGISRPAPRQVGRPSSMSGAPASASSGAAWPLPSTHAPRPVGEARQLARRKRRPRCRRSRVTHARAADLPACAMPPASLGRRVSTPGAAQRCFALAIVWRLSRRTRLRDLAAGLCCRAVAHDNALERGRPSSATARCASSCSFAATRPARRSSLSRRPCSNSHPDSSGPAARPPLTRRRIAGNPA
jgi:hypothetical protein